MLSSGHYIYLYFKPHNQIAVNFDSINRFIIAKSLISLTIDGAAVLVAQPHLGYRSKMGNTRRFVNSIAGWSAFKPYTTSSDIYVNMLYNNMFLMLCNSDHNCPLWARGDTDICHDFFNCPT